MTLHASLSFLTAVTSVTLGMVSFLKNKSSLLNRLWFLLSLCVFLWSLFYGIAITTFDKSVALLSTRILNFAGMVMVDLLVQ